MKRLTGYLAVAGMLAMSGPAMADHHEGMPADGGSATAGAMEAPKLEAGARLMLPSGFDPGSVDGPDDNGIAIGGWIELLLWGHYAVTPELTVGVEVPLILSSPSDLDMVFGDDPDFLQGVMAGAQYQFHDMAHANAGVGIAPAGRMLFNPWGGVLFPASFGDMKVGGHVGAGVSHASGKLMIDADFNLVFQLDSDVNDDGEEKPGIVGHVPVSVLYAVSEQLAAGLFTGLYTGSDFSFDADEGMSIPVVAGGRFAVNDNLGAGAFLGFSSLVTPDFGMDGPDFGVADTLTFGVFATYQQ